MAYLRLGHIKQSDAAGTSKASGLRNCIEYIFNPLKTEDQALIGGYNIFVAENNATESVYKQMISTKQLFNKEDGRQGYHYKLSFAAKDNVTPQLAMEITYKFCERCFTNYECAYSVHTNTAHLHSHIVFNSIDMIDGMKYHYKKGDWANTIQPIANEICKEYGLSALDLNLDENVQLQHKCKEYGKWVNENGMPKSSKKLNYSNQMIRADIDECIRNASSYEEFKLLMTDKGHILNDENKHITVLAPGRTRPCRTYILTPDKATYTKDNILKMIDGTYLSKDETMKILFQGWDKYQKEDRNYLTTVRLSPELAKKMETRKFKVQNELVDMESASYYLYKLDAIDKQLNVMKKQIIKGLEAQEKNISIVNRIIPLMNTYKLYVQTRDDKYKDAYNEANRLYGQLADAGVNLQNVYLYNYYGQSLLKSLADYKKHIFVEKKIANRIVSEFKKDVR